MESMACCCIDQLHSTCTHPVFAHDPFDADSPLSGCCSCGGLDCVSHGTLHIQVFRLTQMEVVVLCVAECDQEANDVDKCWLLSDTVTPIVSAS
jgi:hypothetical protein